MARHNTLQAAVVVVTAATCGKDRQRRQQQHMRRGTRDTLELLLNSAQYLVRAFTCSVVFVIVIVFIVVRALRTARFPGVFWCECVFTCVSLSVSVVCVLSN